MDGDGSVLLASFHHAADHLTGGGGLASAGEVHHPQHFRLTTHDHIPPSATMNHHQESLTTINHHQSTSHWPTSTTIGQHQPPLIAPVAPSTNPPWSSPGEPVPGGPWIKPRLKADTARMALSCDSLSSTLAQAVETRGTTKDNTNNTGRITN